MSEKFTDEQIMTALELCAKDTFDDCSKCAYAGKCRSGNYTEIHKDVLDLIKRQKAEIEKAQPLMAPCEVGTLVYLIDKELLKVDPQNCEVYEDTVYEVGRGVASDGAIKWLCLVEDTGLDFYDTDIGVTAFFDWEAAHRALRKKQEEEMTT